MKTKKVDFHKLGTELWNIANIFRDDTLKTTEYLEEFSYFLFLKLFDDQERQKEELAQIDGKKYITYLPVELRFYTWANKIIIDGEIPINEVVPAVKKIFQDLAVIKDHDGKDLSLFRRLFRNHVWRIKYGPTIRDLLKKLKDLELEQNFDVMGRAYEFVVQKLGEQKQYGQYFTPRHIIHFMVELADPEVGEKIYDPAAGTGGFILRAFEVLTKKISNRYSNDYSLAEKYFRDLKEKSLWAVEKAPDVYKLALMNMILHNDGKSNLYEADSLDNRAQQEFKQKFDVVLSNPPYGPLTQSRVGVFDYHVKRFEALFIQHIMNALKFSEPDKKPSRAVVIILDKILFDSTRAFKGIRQKLLREYDLKAIFSMPAGIFQPYSGVKTTILYFEKPTKEKWEEIKKKNDYATQNIMFFEVKSDGFTLSTQRRPINGAFQEDEPNIYEPPCGDLPKAVKVFKEWQKALETGNIEEFKEKYVDNEQVWIASIDEIKEKDFNLNPGLYRKVERGKVKWEWVKLGEIVEELKIKGDEGVIPYIEIGDIELDTKNYIHKDKPSVKGCKKAFKNNVIVSNVRPTRGAISYIKEKVIEISNGFTVLKADEEKLLPRFLFYILAFNKNFLEYLGENSTGSNYPTVKSFYILNYEIPLPPLEVQKKIVERLDKQQAIIEKAKEMEKAIIEAGIDDAIFQGDWEWVELGGLQTNKKVMIKNGFACGNNNNEKIGLPQLRPMNISAVGTIVLSSLKYCLTKKANIENYFLKKGDIIFNNTNSLDLVGKTAVWNIETKENFILSNHMTIIRPLSKEINSFITAAYLHHLWRKGYYKTIAHTHVNQSSVNIEALKSLKIPLPPIEKQKEIVEFLDVQFQALEKVRKLKEKAEKTIKLILEKEVFGDE